MQAVVRIPGYDSFEQIAVGGMAVVYRARRQSLKKNVAIKVLLPHLAADARFVSRFRQEAEAAARIQHDNIVNIIDYGRAENSHYIVMEFYDGLTVEELLRAHGRLPVDMALAVALHVSYGLDAAHAVNLVHRDIKPANIILTRSGTIKIADFGLAKDVEKITLVTHAGKVVGTPAYMSPEQTRGEPVDKPSDIFSLGVVLYEMLAGKRPFEGSSFSEVVDRIQSFDPPPPGSLNPQVDAPIEVVIARMMAKAPAERHERMSDVSLEIERVVREEGFHVDQRSFKAYFDDPVGYARATDEAIAKRAPHEKAAPGKGAGGVRGLLGRFARVSAAGVEGEADGEEAPGEEVLDPALDCRVMLLSIDRELESPETFALKLSMRLKAPLPRMRSLASRAPCVLVDRLPSKKARWVANVVEELGGKVRIDPIREVQAPPEAPPEPEPPPPPPPEAAEKPQRARARRAGVVYCPNCGWEEDSHAKFCTMCHQSFNKTERIDVRPVHASGFTDPFANPLQDAGPGASRPGRAGTAGFSTAQRLAAGVVLLLVVIGIILATR